MDRRDFLKTTGAAAAAAVAPATASLAGPTPASPHISKGIRELRLAFSWPDNCRGPAESARRLATAITRASDGRFNFSFSHTAQASGALARGAADLTFSNASDVASGSRAFAYFAGLPSHHGLDAVRHAQWLLTGGGGRLWDGLANEHGLKFLLAGHTGASTGLWSRTPIDGVGALEGQRLWAEGLGRDIIRALGADVSDAAPEEVGTAIARGDILGADAGGMITSFAAGLLEEAPHRLDCSINRHGQALALGCTRALWESFSRSDQDLIESAALAEYHTMIAEEEAHRTYFPAPRHAPGLLNATAKISNAIHTVSDAVVAHLASEDAHARRIDASYMAFKALFQNSGRIA